MTATTLDALGPLTIEQPARGYRFGHDAIVLATDLTIDDHEALRVVDLGAGVGAVALALASRYPAWQLRAVEREPTLAGLLEANIARNRLSARVRAHVGDLRQRRAIGLEPHSADLVVSNPPFYPQGRGRVSAHASRASAHHELHGTLADFVACAAYLLVPRGACKMVLPPMRLPALVAALGETDMRLEALRAVHTRCEADAYLLEAWMRRGAQPELKMPAPLVVREASGDYSPEMAARMARAGEPLIRDDA